MTSEPAQSTPADLTVALGTATESSSARTPTSPIRGRAWLLVLLVTGLLIAGAVTASLQFIELRTSPPLRVALNPWPGYEFASLAAELGYFEEEGVKVRLVELSSLSDCRRAFERHQVDGMFSTLVEVLLSQQQSGLPSEIALVADASEGADVILAREDLPDLASLKGRRIAVEDASINEVILLRALQSAGMALADVQVLHMAALEMPRAFAEGRIDAAVSYPPMSLQLLSLGAHTIFCTRTMPGVILDVLAFHRDTATNRPDDIAAFGRAFFRAMEYAEQNPQKALTLMAARQGITADQFREVLSGGIRLIGAAEQRGYLSPGGRLHTTTRLITADLATIAVWKNRARRSVIAGETSIPR
ncbi:MAG: ABC transporter substrate-binding protein [bacterium]